MIADGFLLRMYPNTKLPSYDNSGRSWPNIYNRQKTKCSFTSRSTICRTEELKPTSRSNIPLASKGTDNVRLKVMRAHL